MHHRGGLVPAEGEDSGEPEDADDDGNEADPVHQVVDPEGEARCSGHGIDAHHGDQQAQGAGDQCLDHGLPARATSSEMPTTMSAKNSGGPTSRPISPSGLAAATRPTVAMVP